MRDSGAAQELVLEDQDRIVVAHGRLQYALGIVGIGDRDDLDSRHTGKVTLHALGVLRAAAGMPIGARMTSGTLIVPPDMYAKLGRVVDDLVHGQEEKNRRTGRRRSASFP